MFTMPLHVAWLGQASHALDRDRHAGDLRTVLAGICRFLDRARRTTAQTISATLTATYWDVREWKKTCAGGEERDLERFLSGLRISKRFRSLFHVCWCTINEPTDFCFHCIDRFSAFRKHHPAHLDGPTDRIIDSLRSHHRLKHGAFQVIQECSRKDYKPRLLRACTFLFRCRFGAGLRQNLADKLEHEIHQLPT
jgi:hypothetical protein